GGQRPRQGEPQEQNHQRGALVVRVQEGHQLWIVIVEDEGRATTCAADPLDPQHAGESLAVHRDGDEVVAARDGRGASSETSGPPPSADRRSAERLGDKPERAEAAAPPPAPPTTAALARPAPH